MKYYLYTSSDWSTTDELLSYEGTAESSDIDEEKEFTVVNYFVHCVLDEIIIPRFIERSIQNEVTGIEFPVDHRFVDETSANKFQEQLYRFLNSDEAIHRLYREWTEEQHFPLVVVSEDDTCLPFIMKKFPPYEKYT